MDEKLVEGITNGVVTGLAEVGLRALGVDPARFRERTKIDLTPLIKAVDDLKLQNEKLLFTVSHPNQTAAEERWEWAVDNFRRGRYDDALKEAKASLEAFPYTAKPRLVGGLSALALGSGDEGVELLKSAVKYSDKETDIGAVAAFIAGGLAVAVGAPQTAVELLATSDSLLHGRCPAIVASMAGISGSDSDLDRVKALWWDDTRELGGALTVAELERRARLAKANDQEYLPARERFQEYLRQVGASAEVAARELSAVEGSLTRLKKAMSATIDDTPVKKALRLARPSVRLGWLDMTVGDVLTRYKDSVPVSTWPGNDVWVTSPYGIVSGRLKVSVTDLDAVEKVFSYARTSCDLVTECLRQLTGLASSTALSDADRTALAAAGPLVDKWTRALKEAHGAADVSVVKKAIRARDHYLTLHRAPSGAPVSRLEATGLNRQIVEWVMSPKLLPPPDAIVQAAP